MYKNKYVHSRLIPYDFGSRISETRYDHSEVRTLHLLGFPIQILTFGVWRNNKNPAFSVAFEYRAVIEEADG